MCHTFSEYYGIHMRLRDTKAQIFVDENFYSLLSSLSI